MKKRCGIGYAWTSDPSVILRDRGKSRGPLMTLEEAADEFKVSYRRLVILFMNGKCQPPKPVMHHKHRYYDPQELREWWLRYQLEEPKGR